MTEPPPATTADTGSGAVGLRSRSSAASSCRRPPTWAWSSASSAARVDSRLVGHMPCQPFGEGVELAAVVAGLGDPVGVQQELIAVGEGQHLKARALPGQGPQPERRSGIDRVDRRDAAGGPNMQRRRVAAVDDLQSARLRVSGDHGGHEVVVSQVARQTPFDPAHDGQEVGLVVRGLTEDTEHERGRADHAATPCRGRHR